MNSNKAPDRTVSDRDLEYSPPIETHFVRSKYVKQTFKIEVLQPPQKRINNLKFPVVYVTDGNIVFDIFKGISWLLQMAHQNAPFILVGIGYPSNSPAAGEILRGRDLTFPGCPNFFSGREFPREDVLFPEEGSKEFCGGEDFQHFIEDELIPLIDQNYRTRRGDRTYFGHSMGGGFGLFTLFTKAALFRRYIISSPTLAYHGQTPSGVSYENHDFMFQRAQKFIAHGMSVDDVRLYMSVGTEEQFDPRDKFLGNWQFVSNFYRMAALLKGAAIPGLQLSTEAIHGETHTTVLPIAFTHGLQAVLGKEI